MPSIETGETRKTDSRGIEAGRPDDVERGLAVPNKSRTVAASSTQKVGSSGVAAIKGTFKLQDFVEGIRSFVGVALKNYQFGIQVTPDLWTRKGTWPVAKQGISAARVLKDMVGPNAACYSLGCYAFVYFAQLYGIMVIVGDEEFDKLVLTKHISFDPADRSPLIVRTWVKDPSEIEIGADITLSPDEKILLTKSDGTGRLTIYQAMPDEARDLKAEHVLKVDQHSYIAWGLAAPNVKFAKGDMYDVIQAYAKAIWDSIVKWRGRKAFTETKDMTSEEQLKFIFEKIEVSSVFSVNLPFE